MSRANSETWASEAAMFASFIADAKAEGFVAYPETCGHDLVLEGHGIQVVVEGKLRAGLDVLVQALPPWHRRHYFDDPPTTGADYYAILTPGSGFDLRDVATALDIVCLDWPPSSEWRGPREDLDLVAKLRERPTGPTLQRLRPPLAVEQPAGMPSPRSVSHWKVDAVRIALRLRAGAELRSTDFDGAAKPQTFVQRGWMKPLRKEGRLTVYALGDRADHAPDRLYPEIVAALAVTEAA